MWRFKPKEILVFTQEGQISGRHISIRPTNIGGYVLGLSVLMWVGAVNYQVNVAYLVCFWVVGLLIMAALLTRQQLQGLRITAAFHGEVFAGNVAETQWQFHHHSKRDRTFWWRGEMEENADDDDAIWQRVDISAHLHDPLDTIWGIPITERGYFPYPLYVHLSTTAPFGLFQVSCRVQWQSEAIAYPAPLSHTDASVAHIADPHQPPQQAGIHGDDIAYLKNHQSGTSLQHIAWKVYAKRGELMDKVFDEPTLVVHSERISYRDYPSGTPIDKLASLLTYRVLQAEQTGIAYTLELPHQTITPQNQMREKCLNALALM